MDKQKTLDEYLMEGLKEQMQVDMEKVASEEATSPTPAEETEHYTKMKKLAAQLRAVAEEANPSTVVQDFTNAVKSVKNED